MRRNLATFALALIAALAFVFTNTAGAQVAAEVNTNPAARKQVTHQKVCVTTTAAALGSVLVGRKSISFHNDSASTLTLMFDGAAASSTSGLGEELAPGDYRAYDLGSGIPVSLVATATMVSPSCTRVAQYK
jgi:hypothetical protein